MKHLYEAVITPVEGFGFEAEFPDLEIITQGEDIYDAAFMAQDLLQTWITCEMEAGRRLPTPTMGHATPEGGYVVGIAVECDADTPEVDTMTAQEAADTLGVTKARVYAMARDGVLDSVKAGSAILIGTESVRRRFNDPRPAGRPRKAVAGVNKKTDIL